MLLSACTRRQQAAQILLTEAEKRYAEIGAMNFTAISSSEIVLNDITTDIETRANMDFSRLDQLKLEWQSTETSFTGSIVQSNGEVHLIIGTQKTRQFTSLTDALESAAGISGELTCFVPELLVGITNRLNFVSLTMHPDVQIDGASCYCMAGTNAKGSYLELTIDKKSLLIRQVDERFVVNEKTMAKLSPNGQPAPQLGDAKIKRTQTFTYLNKTNLN